jgi:hypothetical protein
VSVEGIKVNPRNIEVITKWSSPKTITSLQGFLGLTSYYRILKKNYVEKVVPLTTLLKKDTFGWNDSIEVCFKKMKVLMTSTLVLAAPYFIKNFVLKCDALGTGIGAVLMQENHPIAFES